MLGPGDVDSLVVLQVWPETRPTSSNFRSTARVCTTLMHLGLRIRPDRGRLEDPCSINPQTMNTRARTPMPHRASEHPWAPPPPIFADRRNQKNWWNTIRPTDRSSRATPSNNSHRAPSHPSFVTLVLLSRLPVLHLPAPISLHAHPTCLPEVSPTPCGLWPAN